MYWPASLPSVTVVMKNTDANLRARADFKRREKL